MIIYKVYLHKITIIAGDWDKRNAKQTHTTPLFHKKSSKGVKQISKKIIYCTSDVQHTISAKRALIPCAI